MNSLKSQIMLETHLQYNFYPPLDLEYMAPLKEAIELANNGIWNEEIDMPNGKRMFIYEIIEYYRLESFIEETIDEIIDDYEDESED